ncbi:hypothetical protein JKA74_05870 [Marivirga sp. S37H4]|uniref:Outer membrane protein beta-barrel domain-containing protein n=1 Tax=Marivirga aurantiaca TaxID=2802615 RepID=A0A934WX10_9BACT|nr:DUF6588 family protein [Marivirga aurantiaca]MBK6264559.1 hypothetical protein [Marivirga aurantiaca]
MKTNFTKILVGALVTMASIQISQAQDPDEVFRNSQEDGINYLGKYFEPAIISASNGLANGWNNTAKPHKLFGFDITATISVAGIPDADYLFTFRNEDYNTLRLSSGTEAEIPTFAGGDPDPSIQLEAYEANTGVTTSTFDPISGIGLEDIPVVRAGVPIILGNIGVGLPKNTELRVRFSPVSSIGDDISIDGSFGVGVLHDIKQWIPGMKLFPMDISAFVGHNRYRFAYNDGEGNDAEFKSSATNFQVLASKKLLFFTPFVGLGFNAINSTLSFSSEDANVDNAEFVYDNLGGGRLTVGARLKILWVLALSVDYTVQKYNTLNIGLGINVR